MKKFTFYTSLVLFFSQSTQAQQLEFLTPRLIDLGRVQEGEVVKENIRFINRSDTDIKISRVSTSCGCTVPKIDKRRYEPGDTATIAFSFNSRGFRGTVRKSLSIYFAGNLPKKTSFTIQAEVFHELDVYPRYFHFTSSKADLDTVMTNFLTIQNHSTNPISITKIHATSDLIRIFPQSAVIPPNREHLVRIEFLPPANRRKTLYINIVTDYEPKPRINIPVFVEIRE